MNSIGLKWVIQRYEEAAQHFLDGLVLQDSETSHEPYDPADKRGVTSSTLWDSLKSCCLQMQRSDLAALCGARDLDGTRVFSIRNMEPADVWLVSVSP